MKLMLAYIAGPYRDGRGEWYIGQNILAAEAVRDELVKLDVGVLCPHSNSAFCGGLASDDYWLTLGLTLLDRCDCVVVCPCYRRSMGTLAEIKRARAFSIPVFFWPEDREKLLQMRHYYVTETEGMDIAGRIA